MPVCEGRPGAACPDGRNDSSVHLSQGDLMLCRACEEYRFPSTKKTADKPITKKPTTTTTSRSEAGRAAASASSDSPTSGGAAIGNPGAVPHVVNELLTYVAYYRNRANGDALRRVVLTCCTPDDISRAKKTVIDQFRSTFAGSILLTDRRSSTVRSAQEAELDDVIAMFDVLDERQLLQTVVFVAADLERLPKFGPEEVNICTVVSNQQKLSCNVDGLRAEVDQLKASNVGSDEISDSVTIMSAAMADFQHRIEQLQNSINARIDHLNTICTQFSQSVSAGAVATAVAATSTSNSPNSLVDNIRYVDRSSNVVIFGIPENRDVSVWKSLIDEVFRFVVGKDVEVNDAFRMGAYRDGKARPVLVKLACAWDRRLILASCKKLKDFRMRAFIRPDEPPEVRYKKTFDWLKRKAENENKTIIVNNGILSVDGVNVFSLQSGYIRSDSSHTHHV